MLDGVADGTTNGGPDDDITGTASTLGTTLFLTTGTLTFSFFSVPVVASLVITSFSSSSTTGTT